MTFNVLVPWITVNKRVCPNSLKSEPCHNPIISHFGRIQWEEEASATRAKFLLYDYKNDLSIIMDSFAACYPIRCHPKKMIEMEEAKSWEHLTTDHKAAIAWWWSERGPPRKSICNRWKPLPSFDFLRFLIPSWQP